MKKVFLGVGILAFILLAVPAVYAQEQQDVPQAEGQEQEEPQKKARTLKSRLIEATPEQKSTVRNCVVSAARVRKFCRAIERMVHVKHLPKEGFTDRVDVAMQETYILQEHHDKFVGSLNENQEKRLEKRIEKLDTINERISSSLEKLEEELAKERYQRTDVASLTEDIEIDADDFWRIYKGIAVDMGVRLTAR